MANQTFEKLAFVASNRPDAQDAMDELVSLYGNVDAADADAIIPLGGDGFMLETFRRYLPLVTGGLPVYGMNKGTVGFLMNMYDPENLKERLQNATVTPVHPLSMNADAANSIGFPSVLPVRRCLLRSMRVRPRAHCHCVPRLSLELL